MNDMQFSKMSGAGNDFIVVDNRSGQLDNLLTPDFIARICRRGLSVGADGLLELLPDPSSAFRMRYYNSDGRPAAMCGNGGRCIVRFASEAGLVPARGAMTFSSDGGLHRAEIEDSGEVRIWLREPRTVFLGESLALPSGSREVSLVDTGVPHAVVFVDTLGDGAFECDSPFLRRHGRLGPEGANADYAAKIPGGLAMRTWERGVEGETLACGTGAVAVAFLARELLGIPVPVRILTRGGQALHVGEDSFGWWLRGEARTVYRGVLVAP
jgi:diaminopimelate epimerase